MSTQRRIISTENAPAAVGPYSQAVRIKDLVYTAGQIPLDPATGSMVSGPIEVQTRQVLKNLSAVLEAADSSLDRVVKMTVFMIDLGEFQQMNAVYAEFFPNTPPARSAVEVSALPLGAMIEMEAVAVCG
ncbi:MAG: RidA family protein [Thermoanaerobaculales bacterium]|nr:RidA family protein [Thermoanaerobaculales bacterium]